MPMSVNGLLINFMKIFIGIVATSLPAIAASRICKVERVEAVRIWVE